VVTVRVQADADIDLASSFSSIFWQDKDQE
jgi:hypothetical protein